LPNGEEHPLKQHGYKHIEGVDPIPNLENIGVITPSAAQWGYLGASSGIDHYVDRGDPAVMDFLVGDFTTDGVWQDLDLSAICPAGARAVHIWGYMKNVAANREMRFRKKGNVNEINILVQYIQVANQDLCFDGRVELDAARFIQYRATNCAWATIRLAVRGWWI